MYKLLLVSDREDVLDAFSQVTNWGYNGFQRPHIRHDLEGAKDSLQKHHADGIILAVAPEEEQKIIAWLRAEHPLLPIVEGGTTPAEVLEYLNELLIMLNMIRVDFSSDNFDEKVMMIRIRRHFFRRMVGGDAITMAEMRRKLRLMRSRMDPDQPCVLMDLEQIALEEDRLVGRWQNSDHLLERELFQSFGGDVKGFHVLPLVLENGNVFVLAGALRGQEQEDDITEALDHCVSEGIRHAQEYRGIHLRVKGIQILPCLYAFCADYTGKF